MLILVVEGVRSWKVVSANEQGADALVFLDIVSEMQSLGSKFSFRR
jgi:hypothetical protein